MKQFPLWGWRGGGTKCRGSGRGVWDGNIGAKRKERQPKTLVGLELSETSSRKRLLASQDSHLFTLRVSRLSGSEAGRKREPKTEAPQSRCFCFCVTPTISNLCLQDRILSSKQSKVYASTIGTQKIPRSAPLS